MERDIIKLSSCQKYLIVQSFKTLINIINLESNQQQQINFKEAEISQLDYWNDQLLILTIDGKLYLQQEHTYTIYRSIVSILQIVHSSKVLDIIVRDGMLLSLGSDGYLKQTNLRTLQQLYERQLAQNITNGKIIIIHSKILIQYDLKVILTNLEDDSTHKYLINQQGPLKLKQNNLSKEYFAILGQEGMLSVYTLSNNEPIKMIPLSYLEYEIYHLKDKTTIIQYTKDKLICTVHQGDQLTQQEIYLTNIFSILQCNNNLLIVYDNITNPKLKTISNIDNHKFKKIEFQDSLKKLSENQLPNQIKQQVQAIAYYDYTYLKQQEQSKLINQPQEVQNDAMMTNVLKQALIAKDRIIIEYAIEKTAHNLVQDSVNCLTLEEIQELQSYLVDKLISFPQESAKYLIWIKSIILRGVGNLQKLYYFLEERTANINQLKNLNLKIKYLALQRGKQTARKDYRKQPHTIYNEQDEETKIVESKQQQIQAAEIETDNLIDQEDEFDKVYKSHKIQLKKQANTEIDMEIEPDIEF